MAIETEQLEYWGDVFSMNGLQRHMTFDAFMANPRKYYLELTRRPVPPARVPRAVSRIPAHRRALAEVEHQIERMEASVQDLRRIENGHCYEQLKHHANGRT